MTRGIAIAAMLAAAFAAAAADKSSEAIIRLLNSRAAGSPKDYTQAAEIVAADAERGRPLQQFILAVVAMDADLPEKLRITPERRAEYLSRSRDKIRLLAEKKNNSLAWYLLSLEKNDMKYLKLAADGGNVQALNAWGTIMLTDAVRNVAVNTNDVADTVSKCLECFKKAAGEGDANGLYNLGMCYLGGYGCEQDRNLAFQCFRTSAEKGHPEAINNMGGFYRDGIVVEKNMSTAADFFRRSADLGNAYGLLNYGLALQRGEGVEKDSAKAVECFRQAATRGNAEAMNAYGMCFHTGNGVAKDPAIAVTWFRASAARGFPPAMDNLASCYELGLGVVRDSRQSTIWKVRGMAARGDRNAAAWLQQNAK